MINASINFKVQGQVRMLVHKGDPCNPRVDTGIFENIFTRNGLNAIIGGGASSPSQVIIRAVVGSGNATPAITDTSLQAFVAGSGVASENTSSKNYAAPPYHVSHTFRWRFAQGVATGNISEVGLANTNGTPTSATALVSRALVKDASGNPTSITVLADEFLDVIYTIKIFSGSFVTGTFPQIIDGVNISTAYEIGPSNMSVGAASPTTAGWATNNTSGFFSLRPQASTGSNLTTAFATQTLGPPDGTPSGTASRIGSSTAGAVNTALSYCDFTYSAGLDEANISIGSISLAMGAAAYKISFNPVIPKINTKTYSITVRVSVANAT